MLAKTAKVLSLELSDEVLLDVFPIPSGDPGDQVHKEDTPEEAKETEHRDQSDVAQVTRRSRRQERVHYQPQSFWVNLQMTTPSTKLKTAVDA